MSASIRGHSAQLKLLRNGEVLKILHFTNVSINQDSTFSRSMYVGAPIPEGDQSMEGWSGSMDGEIKDAEADEFIDALINENLAGVGVSDYVFIASEQYPDGSVKSYTYFDCQWKLSKTHGGLNTKSTKKLDFQASGRIAL